MFSRKKEVKEEFGSVIDFLPVKNIIKNKIILKNNDVVRVIKVESINFLLKSKNEQMVILESFRRFFKSCDFDMQFFVQTERSDISKHIDLINKNIDGEDDLRYMAEDYIDLVREISEVKGSISRKFYIVIKENNNINENILKVKDCLLACGNSTCECDEQMLKKLFKIINVGG